MNIFNVKKITENWNSYKYRQRRSQPYGPSNKTTNPPRTVIDIICITGLGAIKAFDSLVDSKHMFNSYRE